MRASVSSSSLGRRSSIVALRSWRASPSTSTSFVTSIMPQVRGMVEPRNPPTGARMNTDDWFLNAFR
jgi:hypothetical protein